MGARDRLAGSIKKPVVAISSIAVKGDSSGSSGMGVGFDGAAGLDCSFS